MTLNFPTSPSVNDTYTYNGTTFVWDGEKWDASNPFLVNTANIVDDAVTASKLADDAVSAGNIDSSVLAKNLIHNGAMRVAQRGTSSTTSGIYSVDRWYGIFDQGAVTQSQESTDLTHQPFTEDGLVNYFRLTNDTSSTDAAAFRGFTQIIEAQNAATSGWNYKSSSSYITLSFWVRSSVSQKFYGQLVTMDGTVQNHVFSFTPIADTWTKVVKTIPGNPNSQINLDNGEGIRVRIMPYWGTNFTDPGVSEDTWFDWNTGTRVPDMATDWTSTTGATFDITGVQLTASAEPLPFQHEDYGTTLRKCQRYYQVIHGYQNATGLSMGAARNGARTRSTHTYSGQIVALQFEYDLVTTMRAHPTTSILNQYVHVSGTDGNNSSNWDTRAPYLITDNGDQINVMYSATAGNHALDFYQIRVDAEL